jgi:hypothetical protein
VAPSDIRQYAAQVISVEIRRSSQGQYCHRPSLRFSPRTKNTASNLTNDLFTLQLRTAPKVHADTCSASSIAASSQPEP